MDPKRQFGGIIWFTSLMVSIFKCCFSICGLSFLKLTMTQPFLNSIYFKIQAINFIRFRVYGTWRMFLMAYLWNGMEYPRNTFNMWMSEVSDCHSANWFASLRPTKFSGVFLRIMLKSVSAFHDFVTWDLCWSFITLIYWTHTSWFLTWVSLPLQGLLGHCVLGLDLAGLMHRWALVTMVMAPATELLVTPSTMVIAIAPAKAFTEAAIPPVLSHSNYCPCLVLTLFCLFFGVSAK